MYVVPKGIFRGGRDPSPYNGHILISDILLDVTPVIYNFTILYWTFSDCEGNT